MVVKILVAYLLVFLWLSPSLRSQSIESQIESAVMMPGIDAESNVLLRQSTYLSATVRFAWKTDTHKIYPKIYNYHTLGLALSAATFNNPALGDPLAIYFFIRNPVYCNKRLNLFYEIGSGIAGNFNPYDKRNNPKNKMIGSSINMTGHLSFGFEYHFSHGFSIGTTVGYRHYSNGFMQWPNDGINLVPVTLLANFNLSRSPVCGIRPTVPSFTQFNQLIIFYAPASKNFNIDEKNFFSSTLGLLFLRQVNYKTALGGGLDLFYNSAGRSKVQEDIPDINKILSAGAYLSFEWILTQKFHVNTGAGVYIFRHPENDEHTFCYERISARYSLLKNLFVGIGIKINGDTSDYIEWTLGYVFKKDKNTYK